MVYFSGLRYPLTRYALAPYVEVDLCGMLRRRRTTVSVNAAVEINVLDYSVTVRSRTSTYVAVQRRTQCATPSATPRSGRVIYILYLYFTKNMVVIE